jgi:hypothetical protein
MKRFLDIGQLAGVFLTAAGLFYTATQIQDSSNLASAEIGLRFDDRFTQPAMLGIADAIEMSPQQPILIANNGTYSDDQLEEFLGDYDTLYYLHKQELINDPIMYDLFCTDVQYAYRDTEITQFLKRDRATPGTATDFIGFDKLASLCSSWEKSGKAKFLEE